MDSKVPVVAALGVGYLLGRTHRFKWAVLLGTAVASGRANGLPMKLLEQGRGVLESSPELAKMANSAQRLFDAGRTAAVSAMNSKVESMGSKLEDQAGRVTSIGSGESKKGDRDEEEPEDDARGKTDEDEDEYEDDEYDSDQDVDEGDREESDEDEEAEAEPAGARRSGSSKRPAVRKTGR